MAVYSIRFFSSAGQLVYEHVEQFRSELAAQMSALDDARALDGTVDRLEIWCGERQMFGAVRHLTLGHSHDAKR
jgi:hypothetical protein